MKLEHRIVAALLRLYPAPWRSEYGPELRDILMAHPLSVRVMSDVVWNGLRQRVRAAEPSTFVGLAAMLLILIGLVWNIVAPLPYGHDLTMVLQPSSKTLPTIIVKPLASEFFLLFLVGCGCWTHLRQGGALSQSGMTAMRIAFIAGIPVMLAGILMLSGVLGVIVLGPGDTPTTFHEHGFAFTYYNAQYHAPSALAVLVSPLFRLPESWVVGSLGGLLGRTIISRRRPAAGS